jgi:hypothetical protein
MQVRDMVMHIDRIIEAYHPDYLIIEQNGAQRWFLQDPAMERIRKRVRVIPHNTGRNKGDPDLGIESLAVDFEFGKVRLPMGDAEGRRQSKLLFDEVLTFPQGKTDDVLMALWFIKFNYSRLVPRDHQIATANLSTARGFRTPPRLSNGYRWQARKAV